MSPAEARRRPEPAGQSDPGRLGVIGMPPDLEAALAAWARRTAQVIAARRAVARAQADEPGLHPVDGANSEDGSDGYGITPSRTTAPDRGTHRHGRRPPGAH